MNNWHVIREGIPIGPFTEQEMREIVDHDRIDAISADGLHYAPTVKQDRYPVSGVVVLALSVGGWAIICGIGYAIWGHFA